MKEIVQLVTKNACNIIAICTPSANGRHISDEWKHLQLTKLPNETQNGNLCKLGTNARKVSRRGTTRRHLDSRKPKT